MERRIDWSDLRLFLAVARCGGLRAAATELGISSATLSRRMVAFERATDRKLFVRGARGYALTADGQQLSETSADVASSMGSVERWLNTVEQVRRVRISAGDWTMMLLVQHLNEFRGSDTTWQPDFISSHARLDIARREIDIGIRNSRPEEPWLAAQQFGHVDYAVYAAKDAPDDIGWIGSCGDGVLPPASRWVEENYRDEIAMRVSSPHLGLPLVLGGAGKMVMTRFIGDATAGLEAVGDSIPELRSEQWLVMHQDERNHPPVRAALTALSQVLERYSQPGAAQSGASR